MALIAIRTMCNPHYTLRSWQSLVTFFERIIICVNIPVLDTLERRTSEEFSPYFLSFAQLFPAGEPADLINHTPT